MSQKDFRVQSSLLILKSLSIMNKSNSSLQIQHNVNTSKSVKDKILKSKIDHKCLR